MLSRLRSSKRGLGASILLLLLLVWEGLEARKGVRERGGGIETGGWGWGNGEEP